MSEHPIDQFLKAQDHFRQGEDEEAAQNLALSMGIEEPTPALKLAMRKIFEHGNMLHRGFLNVICNEAKKRRQEGKG